MLLTAAELPARTPIDDYDYADVESTWTPDHCRPAGVRCAVLVFGWFYDTWGSHLQAIIANLKLPVEILYTTSVQKFHMIEAAQREGKLMLFSHWQGSRGRGRSVHTLFLSVPFTPPRCKA